MILEVPAKPVSCVLLIGHTNPKWYAIPAEHLANRGARILGYVYEAHHASI